MKEIVRIENGAPLRVGHPDTDEELEAMFRLRTEVYRRHGYITAEDDKDEYDLDNKCVYFIAKLEEKLVGAGRVIIDDPLPTELYFDFEEPAEIARIPRNKRCEISRLVGVAKGMNHVVSLSVIKGMIEWAKGNDCRGGYSSIFKGNYDRAFAMLAQPISSATLKYDSELLHNYFYKGEKVLPIYYLRHKAAEFMEKMKL